MDGLDDLSIFSSHDFDRQHSKLAVPQAEKPNDNETPRAERRENLFTSMMGRSDNGKAREASTAAPTAPQLKPLSFRGIEDFAEEVQDVALRAVPDEEVIKISRRLRGEREKNWYLRTTCEYCNDTSLPEIKRHVLEGADPNCSTGVVGTRQLLETVIFKPGGFRRTTSVE